MKISRNDLCSCGSGKKYKRCCIDKPEAIPEPTAEYLEVLAEAQEFDALSNRVPELIGLGKLDEAEDVCRLLMDEYSHMVDGLERWAMVHEARGNMREAAEFYRKTHAFMVASGDFDMRTIKFNLDKAKSLAAEGAGHLQS